MPVTWALFVGACLLPAITYSNGEGAQGFTLLLMGWLGPATGHFAWYANPLLVAAHFPILVNEAGSTNSFMLDVGYFVWMAAIVATSVGVRCDGVARDPAAEDLGSTKRGD